MAAQSCMNLKAHSDRIYKVESIRASTVSYNKINILLQNDLFKMRKNFFLTRKSATTCEDGTPWGPHVVLHHLNFFNPLLGKGAGA